jgi:hypothetical protein
MQGIIPASKIGELRKKSFFARNMETSTYAGGTIQILLLLLFIIPAIFFLITQQNTLKTIQPENRTMSPGEVWLQLIPLFGLVWQFFVVIRISDSLRKEINSWTNDTIFGAEGNQAINLSYSRPTYGIGLAMCICVCCTMLSNLGVPLLGGLASLGALVCWIIYWIELARFKSKVQRRFY